LTFETYGAESLPKHGLARYVEHKSFQPLIASVVLDSYPVVRFDFVQKEHEVDRLAQTIGGHTIVAHNASFEKAVLSSLGLHYPPSRFIDSAVVARAAGASGHLEAAAPQLLNIDKVASGKNLIKLFSIPGKYQADSGLDLFDPQVIKDHPDEWSEFGHYCDMDAKLGLRIATEFYRRLTDAEYEFAQVTLAMNERGWCVDVPMVEEMQRRYLENQEQALHQFRVRCSAPDLNLNSLKQMKQWCLERGIKARSFDEKHVASLKTRIDKKLTTMGAEEPKRAGYVEVLDLLETKQVLGGSSLKKLQVILDTATPDAWAPGRYRLYDQYLHCGAGQTLRTSGRSVQMQNLKRLGEPANVLSLLDPWSEWDNPKLAQNLRQVFTASDPHGFLIVGDFKSVESRGLAWLAEEKWKLAAYRAGKDMYKALAEIMFATTYDKVTKDQRQAGKVGELACGYGAAAAAVQAFAANMGIEMSETEALVLVRDWRDANPKVLELWEQLDHMLHAVVENPSVQVMMHDLPDGMRLYIRRSRTPDSLQLQHKGPGQAQSVEMEVTDRGSTSFLKRYFHGCYIRGRNVCYYRPSSRKTGDLWRPTFVDPKTRQIRFFELYGGKLAGILTQSFCRELFFRSLLNVHQWCRSTSQVSVVGQFHDEIVLDCVPGAMALGDVEEKLRRLMSDAGIATTFPLEAEIKSAYRYIK
jgi:DNA polymerase bacteriophage-type